VSEAAYRLEYILPTAVLFRDLFDRVIDTDIDDSVTFGKIDFDLHHISFYIEIQYVKSVGGLANSGESHDFPSPSHGGFGLFNIYYFKSIRKMSNNRRKCQF